MNHPCYQVMVPANHVPREKTLVVLGCPKGGTSLVSGVLHRLGVHMGSNLDAKYEDPDFHPSLPVDQIKNMIKERNKDYSLWGWKRPNTIAYLHSVFNILRNPHLVIVYRNPLTVAQSSTSRQRKKFTQHDIRAALKHYRIIHQTLSILKHSPPRFVCSFEGVLESREQFTLALADFCNIEASAPQLMRCLAFIDPEKGYQAP
jgi:hypothetical protein